MKLLSLPGKKRETRLGSSRFRVAITILQLTGLRVNEIKSFTKLDIQNLLQGKVLEIHQTKTKSLRQISLGNQAIKILKTVERDIDTVFFHCDNLGNNFSKPNWISFVNQRFKRNLLRLDLQDSNLKSHSFRINYVTQLLSKLPIQQVSQIISHSDLRTTSRYDKYLPTMENLKQASNLLFQ